MHYTTYAPRNKYGAKKTEYNGVVYDSIGEAGYAKQLDMLMKAKDPNERVARWERQVTVPLKAYGVTISYYRIDFVVHMANGIKKYVEYKGFPTDAWRHKWKHFEAQMSAEEPEAILEVVKEPKDKKWMLKRSMSKKLIK